MLATCAALIAAAICIVSYLYAIEKYGVVEDAVVVKHRDTGRSRGFGFVTFAQEDNASEAIREMNDQELDGRFLTFNFHSRNGGEKVFNLN